MVDSVPAELLELQNRFETWRANRKYVRESIPDELRSAGLEALRSYLPSLVHRVLKVDPSKLRNKPPAKRSAPRTAAPKKKRQTQLTFHENFWKSHPQKATTCDSLRLQIKSLHEPSCYQSVEVWAGQVLVPAIRGALQRLRHKRRGARCWKPLVPRSARLNHQIFTRSSGFMNSLSPFFTLNAAYQLSILRSGIEPRAASGE